MIKPVFGHTNLNLEPTTDPLPAWRQALAHATPEAMIRLLVEIAAWARQHPNSTSASTLLGDIYLKANQPYAAEKAFGTALKVNPGLARAREGLGLALMQTNRLSDAAKHLRIAHDLSPDDGEILVHWGLVLLRAGQTKRAYARFELATQRQPTNAPAWLNLGLIDANRGHWAKAAENFKHALLLDATLVAGHYNLAQVNHQLGDLQGALAAAHNLIKHAADLPANWNLLAEIQMNAGDEAAATSSLSRSKQLDPRHPDIFVSLAKLYALKGEYDNAEGILNTGLMVTPDEPNIQLELAHLKLLRGDYSAGWDLHEARKRIVPSPVRNFELPDGSNSNLKKHNVLIHAEQGLGDTIMFAGCVPDLLAQCEHTIVEVSTRLEKLFQRSFPTATIVGRDPHDPVQSWITALTPAPTVQIPIGSLPRLFRRTLDAFPIHDGYLIPDPERVEHWQSKIQVAGAKKAIGISWRGGLLTTGRERRSIPLSVLARALEGRSVQLVSLQYGDLVEQELHELEIAYGIKILHWTDSLRDIDEVAALTCALDQVITVCTTQAHLCGALGVAATVLVPASPNWRYGIRGDRMAWYPAIKLVRQKQGQSWPDVLANLQACPK